MISGCDRRCRPACTLHGGLEDGARLHLGDLGIDDAEPAAAEAEHRVELVQRLDARAHALGRDAQLARPARPGPRRRAAGTRAAADRACGSSPAGRSSPRKMPLEVGALERQQLAPARARRSAVVVGEDHLAHRADLDVAKNMCSVRHRPMPSAPKATRLRAWSGWSALVRTLQRADACRPTPSAAANCW